MPHLDINGKRVSVETDLDRSLLSLLRDDLDLTGSKYGCGEGQCGACTVLIDDRSARSCITPIRAALGKKITTIEGLEKSGRLHPVQEAFLETEALQCGYCTSGMIMSGVALLRKNPNPPREEILRQMEGNVCRCGDYLRIVAALEKASRAIKEAGK